MHQVEKSGICLNVIKPTSPNETLKLAVLPDMSAYFGFAQHVVLSNLQRINKNHFNV